MSFKRRILPTVDRDAASALAEDASLAPFLAVLLSIRQITCAEQAQDFLCESVPQVDPFSLADMEQAVARIQLAMARGERIAVYGDYDVDGITATVLLYSYLKQQGADMVYYIPQREGEGYGLHRESIDVLHKQGCSLLVTVDNGISAVDEVAYAASLGIDTVITDHHQPKDVLPDAVAVVDPHRADCPSTFKQYAGVGVAFLLACALEGDMDPVLEEYADLVALGTLADVMPLVGDNRMLVRAGLPLWYTKGFNPHIKMVFGMPLPVGSESECEMLDVRIERDMSLDEIKEHCKREIDGLWDEVKRFSNPHNYYVDLSEKLWNVKHQMLTKGIRNR